MDAWRLASLELLALYATARVIEVGASAIRSRIAWQTRRAAVEPEPWWPTIVALHVFVLVASGAFVWALGRRPPFSLLSVTLFALSAATLLRGWAYLTLGSRWNVRVIDPGEIATGGPYRFVRHPCYLAVIIELVALPVAVGAYEIAVFGTLGNALLLSLRIPLEEARLVAWRPEYRDVMLRRPRLLPRPAPKRAPARADQRPSPR